MTRPEIKLLSNIITALIIVALYAFFLVNYHEMLGMFVMIMIASIIIVTGLLMGLVIINYSVGYIINKIFGKS